jgi:acyl-CoA dehydrogenase
VDFSLSPAAQDASDKMWDFMREEVFPAESEWAAYLREHGEHANPPVMERLKVFGGAGVSNDTPLAYFYAWARVLRIVDGPDAVHRRSIARQELRRERPFAG